MIELTGKQRKRLRGLAHELGCVVQVGARGVTDSVLAQIDSALGRHELIKVRVDAERPARGVIVIAIQESTGAALAGMVGKVAVLYRPHPDPELRRVLLAPVSSRDDAAG